MFSDILAAVEAAGGHYRRCIFIYRLKNQYMESFERNNDNKETIDQK